jgi:NAD(P)-dependent dehydrogenase (short-subunit alcohol dehydrogenase family)
VTTAPLLAGRTAVVTGAGGGIASAVCEVFARHGANRVVAADHDEERLAAVVRRIEEAGAEAVAVGADLLAPDGMAELVDVALGAGPVDVLVNGLGHYLGVLGRFEESTEQDWQQLYDANLLHVLRATKAFLPGMVARGWGRIVNFSSVEGLRAAPDLAVYTAFKAAVDGFTKSVAVDVARHGVRVNAIAVDRTRSLQVQVPPGGERYVPWWTPAGRFGEPVDVANVALFLASDLAGWVVGATVPADGGTVVAGGWYRVPERWTTHVRLDLVSEHLDATEN